MKQLKKYIVFPGQRGVLAMGFWLVVFSFLGSLTLQGQSTNQNYVKTKTYKVATASSIAQPTAAQAHVGVVYYDGLGRPIQEVAHRHSTTGKDIIQHIEYDPYGRQVKEYLPYASQGTASMNYRTSAAQEQASFYNTAAFENTTNPYSEKLLEASPMQRMLKQAAPGAAWKMPESPSDPDHTIRFDYQANKVNEVRRFVVIFEPGTTEIHHLQTQGFYAARQLYKTITKDENWQESDGHNHTTQEFVNKLGQVVLKRTFNNNTPHDTYYVYDIYGNLSYVIPPLAVQHLEQSLGNTAQASRYMPWTQVVEVNQELADKYENLLLEYDNPQVLDPVLFNEYGGQGGMTLSVLGDEISLTLSLSTQEPMPLRNGYIVSLQEWGSFRDKELGRIKTSDYDYTFLIREDHLVIEGEGYITHLNVTLTGAEQLDYDMRYPWYHFIEMDPQEKEMYHDLFEEIPFEDRLTTYVENPYGAIGGLHLQVDEEDNVIFSFQMATQEPVTLRVGDVATLETHRGVASRYLGHIQAPGFSYQLQLLKQNVVLKPLDIGQLQLINISGISPIQEAYTDVDPQLTEGLCYEYRHDRRNRMVEKRIPGKDWEYIVYDRLNRPVMTQDGRLRFEDAWLFTKYDAFNRVVYTGEHITRMTTTRQEMQEIFDNENTLNESRSATAFSNEGAAIHYTCNVYPQLIQDISILTVQYYDDYDFDLDGIALPSASYYAGQPLAASTKGLPTGSKVRTLDTSQWATIVTVYDHKLRPVWTHSKDSYMGSSDITDTHLDFMGKTLETRHQHLKTGMATVTVFDYYTYDTADRLLMHRQKINSQPLELIVHNKYDELGQLIQKKVGDTAPTGSYTYENLNVLQTVDYSYNIRGWLKKINDPNVTLSQKLFAFELHYNTPQNGATPLFNGNISETHWKTSLDGTAKRGYKYTYDALNRLTSADYVTSTPLYIQGTQQLENYFEGNITYDKNGNILTLDRKGLRDNNTIDYIDKLAYSYYPLSNRLRKVQDDAGPEGFKQTTATDPNQYEYDSNGNMKLDRNKEILDITYNHLNLPVIVSFSGGGTVAYTYNALGIKQQKTVQDGTTTTKTDYNGAFVYEQTGTNPKTLQFITQPEGYAKRNSNGIFSYIYQFRDHLGNIRLSYTKNGSGALEVIEIDHYYPFGLKHKGYHQVVSSLGNSVAQKVKFQGQEHQDELGLGWYSFKWRNYMPDIGRFFNIDPLTEQYTDWAPYVFSGNRLIDARELEGLEPHSVHDNLQEAARNFSTQYNAYSIRNKVEVGTQFYKITAEDGTTKYSYTTPVKGTRTSVTPSLSNDFPEGSVPVGNGHMHSNDSNVNQLYDKVTNNPQKDLKKVNLSNIADYEIHDGSNKPSLDDLEVWQKLIEELGDNFERAYLFTPSGLVYTVSNENGKPKVKINYNLSKTNPSDKDSNMRLNNVDGLEEDPEVLPLDK